MAEQLNVTKVGAIAEQEGQSIYVTKVGAIVEMELARLVVTKVGAIVEFIYEPPTGRNQIINC